MPPMEDDDDDLYPPETDEATGPEAETNQDPQNDPAQGDEPEEGEEAEDGEEYSDEESDDDIEIVLDTSAKPVEAPGRAAGGLVNIKTAQTANKAAGAVKDGEATDGAATAIVASTKANIDITLVGQHEGKDIFDVDLESIEDKPWRKPGADITDYFNFGFNEATWKAYCQKQKQMREEMLMQKKINVYEHRPEFDEVPNDMYFNNEMGRMDQVNAGKYQRINPQQRFGMPGMQAMQGMGMQGGMPGMGMVRKGGDMNAFGKRMRDQDDAVIQVTSTEIMGDSREGEMERGDHRFQAEEFHGGPMPPMGMFGGPQMPMARFMNPEMGGMPYDMFRRGGPGPAGPQMSGRAMPRPPPGMRGERGFFQPMPEMHGGNFGGDFGNQTRQGAELTREQMQQRAMAGGMGGFDRMAMQGRMDNAGSPPHPMPGRGQEFGRDGRDAYFQQGAGVRGEREERYYDDKHIAREEERWDRSRDGRKREEKRR
ncbi:cleavage polyadenylation factor subunit fip1 [Blyttiomyces sp. JEL0837]|nr:cleavage polyadenylation factor subunit fip1 [Blyttiomyces sp. JEL0837]